jgi:diacylglycerol O-acyltransferase
MPQPPVEEPLLKLKKMGLLDAYFLLGETKDVPFSGGALQIFKMPKGAGRKFTEDLYQEMRACAVTGSPCNYRAHQDYRKGNLVPQWEILEPEDIDLDYHFRRWALPGKRDMAELNRMVSYLTTQPIDHARPLWELHLIEGIQGNRFAIFTKGHHAMLDGIRGIQWMISGLTTNAGDMRARPIWTVSTSERESKKKKSSWKAYTSGIAQAMGSGPVVGSLVKGVVENGLARWRSESVLASPYSAPETTLNRPVTPLRGFGNCSLSRDKIDAIASLTGTKPNDVMLAVFGGALSAHLEEVDQAPDKSLIAMVPKGLPRKDGGGNAGVPMFVALGSDIADPLERLQVVHQSGEAGKQLIADMDSAALPLYAVTIFLPTLLVPLSDEHSELRRVANLTVSNVPGTKDKLYFKGCELESWYLASILQPGNGLNITIVNYAGCAQVGVVSCPDILPDISGLAERFPRELDVLHGLAKSASPRASAK